MEPGHLECCLAAPEFFSLPFNHADFSSRLIEQFEELLPSLPWNELLQGGDSDSVTLHVQQLAILAITENNVSGMAVFEVEDDNPASADTVYFRFTFNFRSQTLLVKFSW